VSKQLSYHSLGYLSAPVVIAMIETNRFFQDQIKRCKAFAARASEKRARQFWLRVANSWEDLLRAQLRDGTAVEATVKLRFERPIFAKRRSKPGELARK
jgi:hypothetical protein